MFGHIWAWQPSCSMAQNHLNKLPTSFRQKVPFWTSNGHDFSYFSFHISLLLQHNSLLSLREDVQNRLLRWRLWRPFWIYYQHNFSSFWSSTHPVATEQVSAQIDQTFWKRCRKWFSRWRLWRPSWTFDRFSFSYFVSTRRPDAPYQVSTQFDHSLKRRCQKMNSHQFSHINV